MSTDSAVNVGLLLPYRGIGATQAASLASLAQEAGFGSVWAAEVAGADAFAQLAAAAAVTSGIELGTAVVPIGSRTPALLGMAANTVATLSGGRFTLGLGVSSTQIMQGFHGLPPARPLAAVADTLTILDQAWSGGRTSHQGEAFGSAGFALTAPVTKPPVLLAALGPRMRQLARERADGLILNFVPRSAAGALAEATRVAGRPFRRVALIRVAFDDPQAVRAVRRELASYLRVPPYARWFATLGFDVVVELVGGAADLDAAASALPGEFVHDVSLIGPPQECATALDELAASGIEPVIVPVTGARDAGGTREFLLAMAAAHNARRNRGAPSSGYAGPSGSAAR